MIEKQVTFEGILREEGEGESGVVANCIRMTYTIAAITKPGTYTLIDSLPLDYHIDKVSMRVTEAFDGTLNLGTNANNSRVLADVDFRKTVGKKDKALSLQLDAGQHIRLYLGAGTKGKIEVSVYGDMAVPTLL